MDDSDKVSGGYSALGYEYASSAEGLAGPC